MSGSPSSPGGDIIIDTVDCNIFEKTILNSPNPVVLSRLESNDVLNLRVEDSNGRRSLVAIDNTGEVAGSITSMSMARLIRCIESGHNFIALVIEIDGGRCDVQIRPESA